MNDEERGKVFMKSNSPEPLVVDKEGNIYYSAKVINELENKEKQKLEQEIEILNENNQAMQEEMIRTWKKLDEKENIIKEAREYIKDYFCIDEETGEYYLTHTFDTSNLYELLKILDKGE